MHHKSLSLLLVFVVLIAAIVFANRPVAFAQGQFEIWLVDQSNSNSKTFGGTIYIYDGYRTAAHPSTTRPTDVIDLGAGTADVCRDATGVNPVRPHMLLFNSTKSHAALSFVASGHVVFFDARTRAPLACFRTEPGANGARQAHAAWPTGDERYLLVANQNGKKIERISTDYAHNQFVQEPAATLDLANCITPNSFPCQELGMRPDNAPICPFTASNNGPAFVSLRGGGLFVVDWQATPMRIIAEYDRGQVPANGCGFIESRGWVYANAGGATRNNLDQFTVYRLPMSGYDASNPPNTPAVQVLYNDEAEHRDAHGVAVTRPHGYVWAGDRARNVVEVFHGETGAHLNTINLVSLHSSDPTPDLFATSPEGSWIFMSTRGPNPLSGDPHSSTGSTPGMLVVQVLEDGKLGTVRGLVPITNRDVGGMERADAHGINVRGK